MSAQSSTPTKLLSRLDLAIVGAGDWLLDIVFPPRCGSCGRVDYRFCPECQSLLAAVPLSLKPRRSEDLDATCATGLQTGILADALKAFKYSDAVELRAVLAERLVACLGYLRWDIDVVAPVPLHADRERERGYNQSSLLGERLAQAMSLAYEPAWLKRIRHTEQQAQLDASQRPQNVAGAFQASDEVANKSVLLVDDVVTTGATLAECALALRANNARAVYALTVSSSAG